MKNNLIRKIAPYVFGGLCLIGSGCSETYEIDGNKVIKGSTIFNNLREGRGDSIIIRYIPVIFGGDIGVVKINGEKYTQEDTLVYNKANERYHYLNNKIDSINASEEKNKINLEQKKEQERINQGLKAFE